MTTQHRSSLFEGPANSWTRTGIPSHSVLDSKIQTVVRLIGSAIFLMALIGGTGCDDSGVLSPEAPPMGDETNSVLAQIQFRDDSLIDFERVDGLVVVSAEGSPDAEAFRKGIEGREDMDPIRLFENLTDIRAPAALVAALRGPEAAGKSLAASQPVIVEALPNLGDSPGVHGEALASSGQDKGSCGSTAFNSSYCWTGYDFQFCFPSVQHNFRRTEDAKYARAFVQPYSGRVTMTFQYESGGTWRTKTSRDVATCTPYTAYVSVWEFGGGGLTAAIPMRVKVAWNEGDRYGVSFFGYR